VLRKRQKEQRNYKVSIKKLCVFATLREKIETNLKRKITIDTYKENIKNFASLRLCEKEVKYQPYLRTDKKKKENKEQRVDEKEDSVSKNCTVYFLSSILSKSKKIYESRLYHTK
jgi:hypothetical protein